MRTLHHDTEQRGRLVADKESIETLNPTYMPRNHFVTDDYINSFGLKKQVQSVEEQRRVQVLTVPILLNKQSISSSFLVTVI